MREVFAVLVGHRDLDLQGHLQAEVVVVTVERIIGAVLKIDDPDAALHKVDRQFNRI